MAQQEHTETPPATSAPWRALGTTAAAVIGAGAGLARVFDQVTRRTGSVTFSQYSLLGTLREAYPEPLEPWHLGKALGAGSAQVTALLDGLERGGLVARGPHPADRRRRLVGLTPAGVDCVEAVARRVRTIEDRLLTGAALSGLETTAGSLRALVDELSAVDPSFLLTADPGHHPDAAG